MAKVDDESVVWAHIEQSLSHFLYRQLFITPKAARVENTSLKGKVGIVTGANTGIGFHACRQLLQLGVSHVILAVRNETKGNKAKEELVEFKRDADVKVEVWKLDMQSYSSIKLFADRVQSTLPRLDFAILNAGIKTSSLAINPSTGFEEMIQTNYLSTALLAILLLPTLQRSGHAVNEAARLTIVTSETAGFFNFPELERDPLLPTFKNMSAESFSSFRIYAISKLLQLMFLRELAARTRPEDGCIVNAVNPGLCHGSQMTSFTQSTIQVKPFEIISRLIGRTMDAGARTYVDAVAVKAEESHGKYLSDCIIRSHMAFTNSAKGVFACHRLWNETIDLFELEAPVKDILASTCKVARSE